MHRLNDKTRKLRRRMQNPSLSSQTCLPKCFRSRLRPFYPDRMSPKFREVGVSIVRGWEDAKWLIAIFSYLAFKDIPVTNAKTIHGMVQIATDTRHVPIVSRESLPLKRGCSLPTDIRQNYVVPF